METTIDMHGDTPETKEAKVTRGAAGRAPSRATPSPNRPPRVAPPLKRDDGGYPFEDLTCDLSAEPIAAATSLLPDPHPTIESPPPQPTMRGEHLIKALSAAAPKSIAAAVKRAPARTPPSPPMFRAEEDTSIVEQTALLEPPLPLFAPPQRDKPAPASAAPASAASTPAASTASASGKTASPLGQRLRGRYELQLLLGRGGMASVYKAIDHDRVRLGLADKFVAVKVVQADASQPARPAALIQEFQSAQRLSHPNIINVFDIDRDGDTTFYSMELLSGARLSQVLRRVDGSVLQRRYALAIIRDIGAAVTHAHARGVVHADLKPSNVMITHLGELRVLDFGGSSMPPREPWVSAGDGDDGYHHATPAYASCEQLERRRADPRDDIYALACIAYLLLSGRHPFDYLSSLMARSRRLQPARPAGMPRRQWRTLRQGLNWSRADQPPSLEAWLAELGLDAAAPKLPRLVRADGGRRPHHRPVAATRRILRRGGRDGGRHLGTALSRAGRLDQLAPIGPRRRTALRQGCPAGAHLRGRQPRGHDDPESSPADADAHDHGYGYGTAAQRRSGHDIGGSERRHGSHNRCVRPRGNGRRGPARRTAGRLRRSELHRQGSRSGRADRDPAQRQRAG